MKKKILLIVIFLILIAFVIAIAIPYICKARANDMVKAYSSNYFTSLTYSKARLNLISHFPDVTLTLSDFELKNDELNVIAAEKVNMMVGLSSILKKKFTNLKEVVVKKGTITCGNINGNSELYAYGVNMSVKNNNPNLKGELMANEVSYAKDGVIYCSGMSLDAEANGLMDFDKKVYSLNNSNIDINGINFKLDGDMSFANNNLKCDVSFVSDKAPISDIVGVFYGLSFSPEKVYGNGVVSGYYNSLTNQGDNVYSLSVLTDDGKIKFGSYGQYFIALNGKVDVCPESDGYILSVDSKTFKFNEVVLDSLVGTVAVKDHKYDINSLNFDFLDGAVTASGSYDIHDVSSFTADIDASAIDLSKIRVEFPNVGYMLPLSDSISSIANIKLRLKGNAGGNGNSLNSLSGNGEIHSDKIAMRSSKGIETIRTLLQQKNNSISVFENVDIFFTIANGKLNVAPFTTNVDNLKINVSGSQGFDGDLNYLVKAEMPKSDMGQTVNSILNSISRTASAFGFNVPMSDAIKINVKVSGTLGNPIVTPVN